jgi:hypothetical protein
MITREATLSESTLPARIMRLAQTKPFLDESVRCSAY